MCSIIKHEREIIKTPIQLAEHFLIPQIVTYTDEGERDFDQNGCLCQIDIENTLIQNRILFTYDEDKDIYTIPENLSSNILHSLN